MMKVYNQEGTVAEEIQEAQVFNGQIRNDLVNFVWHNMKRNTQQAFGVFRFAGVQCTAHSWGPGRAKARLPRCGGTGAYASMARGGHRYGTIDQNRRWFRKTPKNMKRFAVVSAIAASKNAALVEAHGHKIQNVEQLPLIVDMHDVKQTKEAVKILKAVHAYDDVEAVIASKQTHNGKGANRNRPYTEKCGPLVIYAENDNISLGFRAIPGVQLERVDRINLLDIAQGGKVGRFCVWTKNAYQQLDKVFASKSGFRFPLERMHAIDMKQVQENQAIKSIKKEQTLRRVTEHKVNPFKCEVAMKRLNPAWK